MTDLGTTPRRALSRRDRLAVWEAHKGVCVICGIKIDGVREKWIVEHVRALELSGEDTRENMAPAHEACGIEKTRDDHARAAKAKRVKAAHLGIKATKRPMLGSRQSKWKRKFSGEVVAR